LRSCATWSLPCSTWSCLFYHILTYCALNKVPPSIPVCKDCFHPLSPLSYFGLELPHRLFPCDNHHCLRCTPFDIKADLLYSLLTSGLPHHVHVAHYGRPTVTLWLVFNTLFLFFTHFVFFASSLPLSRLVSSLSLCLISSLSLCLVLSHLISSHLISSLFFQCPLPSTTTTLNWTLRT
jgi:hypothetical protein